MVGPLGFEPRTDGLKVTSSRFISAILALPPAQDCAGALEGESQLYLIPNGDVVCADLWDLWHQRTSMLHGVRMQPLLLSPRRLAPFLFR